MEVVIDSNKCIGCGVCMQVCPSVFGLDEEEGKAFLIEDASENEAGEHVREAVDCCPVACINE